MTTTTPTVLATARVGALLRADDLDRARKYYSEMLGFEVEDDPSAGQFVVRAGGGTRFAVYERPGLPAPANTTLGFEVEDFSAAMEELRSRGVVFEEYDLPEIGLKTEHGVAATESGKVAWFLDSEGNILSIMQAS